MKTAANTESAIWSRLLQPAGQKLTLAAARSLLKFDFSNEDKDRMQALAASARDGSLSRAEQEEIHEYERVGNLLALMKSKARQRLKHTAQSNGSSR